MVISNTDARRLLLSLNGLAPAMPRNPVLAPVNKAGSAWVLDAIMGLGFVQIDPISAVERAHHHILFARDQRFRQGWLKKALEQERTVFENWTHDAAVLPSEWFPYWKHYFSRFRKFEIHSGYRGYFAPATPEVLRKVLRRVEKRGAMKPADFKMEKVKWHDPYFARPSVAKLAMEFLWRTGKLAVAHREGQTKVYDLAERVIPQKYFNAKVSKSEHIDWACRASLSRLGFGNASHISRFFDAVSRQDAAAWCEQNKAVVQVRVGHADGTQSSPMFALAAQVQRLRETPRPPEKLRLLNPFDPLIHDRQRTQRIFGFEYKVEIWVPRDKRKYGYYVLPILEGDRFTGRIDLKADRKAGQLNVLGLWWEPRVKAGKGRMERLERELRRLARFAGTDDVHFEKGYLKS